MEKFGTLKISLFTLFFLALAVENCGNIGPLEPKQGTGGSVVAHNANSSTSTQSCTVDAVRYPTTVEDFQNLLYGNRGFLAEYNGIKHLGHDIIYAEGTAIHAITCGKIVFYGPASGYGTLVIVIEHKLATPLSVTNGNGTTTAITSFLTIYGHQRKTPQANGGNALSWQVGDNVGPDDVIGYVQSDALNGDGPPHLHLGVRLQSMAEAKAIDPSAWFRGNDTSGVGQYKKYYTDPATFIPKLQSVLEGTSGGDPEQAATALHYPIGTLLQEYGTGYWLVVGPEQILDVSGYQHLPTNCAVNMPPQALNCYTQVQFDPFSLYLDAKVIKLDGESQVYMLYPGNGFEATGYRTFLSYDSFLSWGYKDSDIANYPVAQKNALIGDLKDQGMVGFWPGALVKGKGQSEIAVANQAGLRRPIFNWDVFQALGYKPACIFEIEPATLDAVAGEKSSEVITLVETQQCGSSVPSQICSPGTSSVCACGGNIEGVQVCSSDGQSFEPCVCPDAGSGGSGGASGTGGMSNAGGTAGSGGSGQSGNGGSIEVGGASGSGGSVGFGGSTGQGGSSGQGGSTNVGGSGGLNGTGGSTGSGGSTSFGGSSGLGGSTGTGGSTNVGGSSGSGGMNAGGSGGSVVDAGTGSSPCQTKGIAGQATLIINAPVGQTNNLSVFGWVDYPGWSGVPDLSWHGWAWGSSGNGELIFQKGNAYQGTKYIFAPGVSSGTGQPQDAWYCDQTSCPIGTFIVCNGLQEACRVQAGVLSGGASYTPNQASWQNIQCVLP
ncbi:MAG: M23 family metallopeptidase [Patescibacteria group bacterium]|jgi:hypothetical protein